MSNTPDGQREGEDRGQAEPDQGQRQGATACPAKRGPERGAACSLEPSAPASESPSPTPSFEQALQSLGDLRLRQVICIIAHDMTFAPRTWCCLANLYN